MECPAPEDKAARSQAIAAALVEAGRVPARVIAVAEHVVDLAEHLQPIGNLCRSESRRRG